MKIVSTKNAAKAVGPYSQAIIAGDFVFCAGQIGKDPKTDELLEGIENQTRVALNNIEAIVKAAGSNKNKIVKTTIYLTNINDFQKVNEQYASFFGSHKPARATIEVRSLPKGALIEIETIALI